MINIHLHIPKAQKTLNRLDAKSTTPRYLIVKLMKQKTENPESKREVTHQIKGSSIRLTADLSSETLETRTFSKHLTINKKFNTQQNCPSK